MAYRDRSASVNGRYAQKLSAMNGMLSPTVVMDGQVVGTWKRTFVRGAVVIAFHPFRALTTSESRALTAAASRYGDFSDLPITLA